MTPDEIQDLFENIPEDEESRTQALKQVLATAQKLQEARSPELKVLAEQVGNGSREERWRIPLGRSGLLGFFLSLIKGEELDPDLTAHALRVAGNSCADQDENRQRVVDSGCLPQLVKLLVHDSLLRFAIPVLFNICVDYEPAQAAASKAYVNKYLIDLVATSQLQEKALPFMNIVYKLLGLSATQEFEPDMINPQAPYLLLTQANLDASKPGSPDLDGFLGLCSAALAYLSHQQLQEIFLETPNAIEVFIAAFRKAIETVKPEDAEEQAQLNQLQLVFMKALADLSANSRFISLCSLDGSLVNLLLLWISSSRSTQLQAAACLALGNLARSDSSSSTLVQEMSVHKPLITILSSDSATDAQLLHSILGFLKNLAIPARNKAVLGGAGLLDPNVLPRIWNLDTQPQVQFDAVSLARLLFVNCSANVRRVCAHSDAQGQTGLHQLAELHRKADHEPIKMETARAVANVCRVLHSENPPGSSLLPESSTSSLSKTEAESLLHDFYGKHTALADMLAYLGLQTKFPVLRSELWFVLALMARSVEGVAVVTRLIRQHSDLAGVLAEAVTGEKIPELPVASGTDSNLLEGAVMNLSTVEGELGQLEPQQVDLARNKTITKVDRENGLVLIGELLKRCPDDLPPSVSSTFSQLLVTGGKLVLSDRTEES